MNSIRGLRLASFLSALLLFASGELCMLVNCTLRPAAAATTMSAAAPSCPSCHPAPPADAPRPAAPSESAMPCCIAVTLAAAPSIAPHAAAVPTPLPAVVLAAAPDPLAPLAIRRAPAFGREHAPPAEPPPTSRLLRAPPSA